ncbi:hypothetical protein O181_109568 [Austropuccinia psidii MF-1]|uniref:Reverse transcriptase/retrotransposon-derived protein RNase H-like domain-containing protein n=1 Tax=Austropuccinia psidii MF-1 TaxID=1389203 RepID=A0A9Q3PPY9_9BASI|nr:hypothetical protein [Austropuccinia psidii MF-1]
MSLVLNTLVMFFLLKAARWTKQNSSGSQLATSKNPKALQSFVGLANFYRRLIKNYSKKISSLTSCLKKYSCFPLNEEALSQLHQLKESFTTAPVLSHFNPSLPTIVETDASDYALGAIPSQVSDSGKHPIESYSRKLIPEELNYAIHDKELLGIVWALKPWRAFLLSLSSPFEVLTNHSSLQRLLLTVKPSGLNSSLKSTSQSLTALAA